MKKFLVLLTALVFSFAATAEKVALMYDNAVPPQAGFIPVFDGSGWISSETAGGAVVSVNGAVGEVVLGYADVGAAAAAHATDTNNPHAVTAAQALAVALSGNETISGIKTFTSSPVIPAGLLETSPVTKAQLDAVAMGWSWKDPVLDATLSTDAGLTPTTGNRYVVNGTGAAGWAGHDNDIATYSTDHWTFTDSSTGDTVMDTTHAKAYTFNGSAWVQVSASEVYTASLGVIKSGNDFRANFTSDAGLKLNGNALEVDYDDVTIGMVSGVLAVKDLSITAAKLAGSIPDSKLNAITTAAKVSGTSFTALGSTPAGAGILPVANLGSGGTGSGTKVLTDAGTFVSIGAGGAGTVMAALMDFRHYNNSSLPVNANTTPMVTHINPLRFDASTATSYRIVIRANYSTWTNNVMFKLQYSADNSTWYDAESGTAGRITKTSGSNTVQYGNTASLVAGAKSSNYWRVVAYTASGAQSVNIFMVYGEMFQSITAGDVSGPLTTTEYKVPRWGAANKVLEDGLTVGTGASNLVQLTADSKLPAVDGSLLTGISSFSGDAVDLTWDSATPDNDYTIGTRTVNPAANGKLLMHCDASPLVDSLALQSVSSYNVTYATGSKKFGSGSMWCGSWDGRLTITPGVAIGTSAFAFTFWVRNDETNADNRVVLDNGSNLRVLGAGGANDMYGIRVGATTTNTQLTAGSWFWIAIVRASDNTVSIYKAADGAGSATRIATYSDASSIATLSTLHGAPGWNGFNGYLDELFFNVGDDFGYSGASITVPSVAYALDKYTETVAVGWSPFTRDTLLPNVDAAAWRADLGLGSAATLTAGTGAYNVVQLDVNGALPSVDGQNLQNIPEGKNVVKHATKVCSANGGYTPASVLLWRPGAGQTVTIGGHVTLVESPTNGHDNADFNQDFYFTIRHKQGAETTESHVSVYPGLNYTPAHWTFGNNGSGLDYAIDFSATGVMGDDYWSATAYVDYWYSGTFDTAPGVSGSLVVNGEFAVQYEPPAASTFIQTLLDDTSASGARTTLGLGTAATQASTAFMAAWVAAPAAANSTGTAGQMGYDGDYLYICTATNTWKRVAIATW